jgi:hypothetical protein
MPLADGMSCAAYGIGADGTIVGGPGVGNGGGGGTIAYGSGNGFGSQSAMALLGLVVMDVVLAVAL